VQPGLTRESRQINGEMMRPTHRCWGHASPYWGSLCHRDRPRPKAILNPASRRCKIVGDQGRKRDLHGVDREVVVLGHIERFENKECEELAHGHSSCRKTVRYNFTHGDGCKPRERDSRQSDPAMASAQVLKAMSKIPSGEGP
jgi:hypothetical protein